MTATAPPAPSTTSIVAQLMAVIEDRKRNPPAKSYTTTLLNGGIPKIGGKVLEGLHGIGGEWGHNPLPWPEQDELPVALGGQATVCYCGKPGCIETWLSGTGIQAHFGDSSICAADIVSRAEAGDDIAERYLQRVEDRMARAFATIINVLDPDVVVLGGGVSNIERFYASVPRLLPKYVFSEYVATRFVRNVHGDSSGVRGAAWLWPRA